MVISQSENVPDCLLFLSEDYRQGTVYIQQDAAETDISFALDNSLMLFYVLNTATRDTLLIHASVIRNGERAYVFLGKSGTGKPEKAHTAVCGWNIFRGHTS